MSPAEQDAFQPRLPLLEYLQQHGWKPVRHNGGEEVAGLCPLHDETRPSFYVNRRKQVFYCHGCGRGGGLARLIRLLGNLPEPAPEQLPAHTCHFHQRQLERFEEAPAYLAKRGIRDRTLIERMGIGYAPGACLRGYLERLGYTRKSLLDCGLVDERGRDAFFRCLTFPLAEADNLYGRSITHSMSRHHFLPGSKGGLYGWAQASAFSRVIVVEGLFDVAALWQAGFPNTAGALGSHLNNLQLVQLCRMDERVAYVCFDPASFFASGAGAGDFQRLMERARP
jgi:DNA primase